MTSTVPAALADQRIGLPILHTWASTLWIITTGISNELEAWLHADVVLADRAVPDALGYYHAALAYRREQPDSTTLAYLQKRWSPGTPVTTT